MSALLSDRALMEVLRGVSASLLVYFWWSVTLLSAAIAIFGPRCDFLRLSDTYDYHSYGLKSIIMN